MIEDPIIKIVEFSPNVYRLNAIKKSAYKFGDKCHIKIDINDKGRIIVSFQFKKSEENINKIIGDFCNEALDQDLRELIAEETGAIRNILLAQAFSSISIINPEADRCDHMTDPLGIDTGQSDY
jgi:His-Xaa-Ser system protein HxsD